jgi:hypothetical protein
MTKIDEIELVRSLRTDIEEDPIAVARARLRLQDAAAGQRVRSRQWRRRTVRRVAVTATAVFVAAALFANVPMLGVTSASAAAAAVLHEAAENASHRTNPAALAGKFVYLREHGFTLTSGGFARRDGNPIPLPSYLSDLRYESWSATDGRATGRVIRIDDSSVRFFSPAQKSAYQRVAGDLPTQSKLDQPLPPYEGSIGNPTAQTLAALPTDPTALLFIVYKEALGRGHSIHQEALEVIAGLLGHGDAMLSPQVRSALFEAAARIPGVTVTADVVNIDGVTGVAIGRLDETDGQRPEIIVDPKTSRVIGRRTILVDPKAFTAYPIPAGTVVGLSATTSAIVDRVGQTPAKRG